MTKRTTHVKRHNRFEKGSGAFKCSECGKLTRETGHNEADHGMCKTCIDAWGWANGILDGHYTVEDIPEAYRDLVKKYLE